ncbi:hypothetical protein BDY17DRAFT_305660 [Neohortaea acidophila]|uniref:Uncharacterized protein n=1 Tax=Neohortaea acidophila TaxID=245834 RepID=A0A6A6PFD9_9PEZI|nr:uncharacterized protein BDY17DRAFT_305660 [Neohortaea acidophila]KAF2478699.1 hypothetical protein BDY17DRAFT_305660 [Neohortaea acidophila]
MPNTYNGGLTQQHCREHSLLCAGLLNIIHRVVWGRPCLEAHQHTTHIPSHSATRRRESAV